MQYFILIVGDDIYWPLLHALPQNNMRFFNKFIFDSKKEALFALYKAYDKLYWEEDVDDALNITYKDGLLILKNTTAIVVDEKFNIPFDKTKIFPLQALIRHIIYRKKVKKSLLRMFRTAN